MGCIISNNENKSSVNLSIFDDVHLKDKLPSSMRCNINGCQGLRSNISDIVVYVTHLNSIFTIHCSSRARVDDIVDAINIIHREYTSTATIIIYLCGYNHPINIDDNIINPSIEEYKLFLLKLIDESIEGNFYINHHENLDADIINKLKNSGWTIVN